MCRDFDNGYHLREIEREVDREEFERLYYENNVDHEYEMEKERRNDC